MPSPDHDPAWTFGYDGFDAEAEPLREALTSTGNGHWCIRAAAEWEDTDAIHYAGTYAHGIYNRETTILGGRPVLNEDLVNLPNSQVLKVRIEGERAVKLADVQVLEYRHEFDVRHAVLIRELRFRDHAGRETSLRSRRFVSMADVHVAGIEWTIRPENWSGRVEVISGIDARVTNAGVARYQQLEGRHLDPVSPRTFGPETIALKARTRQSDLYLSHAARTRVFLGDAPCEVLRTLFQVEDYVQQMVSFDVHQGVETRVEKMITFHTSRDRAVSDTLARAGRSVRLCPDFAEALARHGAAWDELWRTCDVRVPEPDRVQRLLRLHISHLLQVCSRHTADRDAGVPARGLNGEAYRGHVFWDELYVLPFLTSREPEISRGLLLYRYRRLGEARAAARAAGLKGAMFPWQSGSDGTEETQEIHVNPVSGHWDADLSHHQRHVNAAIFYNIWHYYLTTGDLAFLGDFGAEMMLDIARFWASLAHFDPERERYEIHGVMGPDEFHERYPGAAEAGLRNNAYTNVMVAWLSGVAGQVLDLLPVSRATALRTSLGIDAEQVQRWQDMAGRMFVPFHGDGVISQFEGYEQLAELDWDAYRDRYGNIQRLDRILRAEGDDPNRYQVTKQADTVMLFYLFTPVQIRTLLDRLGYAWPAGSTERTVAYYDRRTSHGSTLSFVTHAAVLARSDPEASWERFQVALHSDVEDVQGGTTKEGIHLGVMSGTLDVVQRTYAGVHTDGETLRIDPNLPPGLPAVSFTMQFHGVPLHIAVHGDRVTVGTRSEGGERRIRVDVRGQVRDLRAGDTATFTVARADTGT